jgi:hypothetical protein
VTKGSNRITFGFRSNQPSRLNERIAIQQQQEEEQE